VTPTSEHALDLFHISMRLTVLERYARGTAHHEEAKKRRKGTAAKGSYPHQMAALALQSTSRPVWDQAPRRPCGCFGGEPSAREALSPVFAVFW
jgi:hypothetical protein